MSNLALPNYAPKIAKTSDFTGDRASAKASDQTAAISEQDIQGAIVFSGRSKAATV